MLGIETRHTDALGVIHEPDAETPRQGHGARAFGLPAEPERAAGTLAEARRAMPLGLDPLYVVAAEAPVLPLPLPPEVGRVEWRLELEQGDHAEGSWQPGNGELRLPDATPLGYHRFSLSAGGADTTLEIAVAPAACHLPPELQQARAKLGLTTQLYSLRSEQNWGMGDFSDLARLARAGGALGAVTVGINPLHALFASEPRHASPYSPSSRVQLDYLYIDPATVPGFADDEAIRALVSGSALAGARAVQLVDHEAVAALKRPVLEALFRRFHDKDLSADVAASARRERVFGASNKRAEGRLPPSPLPFEALHERFNGNGGQFSWQGWPADLRATRTRLRSSNLPRRIASGSNSSSSCNGRLDIQLAAAAEAGRDSHGLSLGLYRDLAVGVNPQGAEAWADQELVVPGMGIGAPPDPLSRAGQDWGLAPVNPLALRRRGFALLHRCASREYASCRRPADRPCNVAAAALLGAGRTQRGRRRLCAIPVRRAAAPGGAGKPAPAMRGHRRGSRHRALRVPRNDAGGKPAVLPRRDVRTSLGRQFHLAP